MRAASRSLVFLFFARYRYFCRKLQLAPCRCPRDVSIPLSIRARECVGPTALRRRSDLQFLTLIRRRPYANHRRCPRRYQHDIETGACNNGRKKFSFLFHPVVSRYKLVVLLSTIRAALREPLRGQIGLFAIPIIFVRFSITLRVLLPRARVSCKPATVYRVHRTPQVYGVSCRLTPGKPPDRRADGGRWDDGIGLDEERRERGSRGKRVKERSAADSIYTHIFCLRARRYRACMPAIVCPRELIRRERRKASWKKRLGSPVVLRATGSNKEIPHLAPPGDFLLFPRTARPRLPKRK